MFCDKCGTENRDEAGFCVNCGEKLSDIKTPMPGKVVGQPAESGGGDFLERFKIAVSDRYEVIRELGRGGMAIVFLAKDKRLERQVALKLLPKEISMDKNFSERFMREARISAKLSHPNIIQIHDVENLGEFTYYSMSFIDGVSLSHIIKKSGALNPKIVTRLGIQICFALQAAHEHNVIHRDIKPENIIVSKKRMPIVVDFGIARAMSDARLSSTGMFIGTPQYMSPEQIKSGEVDPRSDIYSMGGVLYEMTVGKPTYQERDTAAIMYKQVHELPTPPHEVNPDVPRALSDIIMKALSKAPEDRPASAMELGKLLHEASLMTVDSPPQKTKEKPKVFDASGGLTAEEVAAAVEDELSGDDSEGTILMMKPPKSNDVEEKQQPSEDEGSTKIIQKPQQKKKKPQKEEKKGVSILSGLILLGITTIIALGALSFIKKTPPTQVLPKQDASPVQLEAEKPSPKAEIPVNTIDKPQVTDTPPPIKRPAVRPKTLVRTETPEPEPTILPQDVQAATEQKPPTNVLEAPVKTRPERTANNQQEPIEDASPVKDTPPVTKPQTRELEVSAKSSEQPQTPTPAPNSTPPLNSRVVPERQEPVKTAAPKPVQTAETVSIRWAKIPGGTFEMGDFVGDLQKELLSRPVHRVTVSPFEISQNEVTVRQYAVFLSDTGRTAPNQWQTQLLDQDRPVIYVSWKDADAFAKWAGASLPTESEWEFAARGGLEKQKYPWGSESPNGNANLGHDWGQQGNGWQQYLQKPGQYAANKYGLFDMAGNVWEWTADWFGPYQSSLAINPAGSKTGNMKVIRGGGWNSADNFVRNSFRGPTQPGKKDAHIGFRIARKSR